MPYQAPFALLTAFGHFGGTTGVETWSTSCKIGGISAGPDLVAFLESVNTVISNFWSSALLGAGSGHYLTELRAAVIGTDGKYLGGDAQATTIRPYVTPVQGVGSGTMPWTTAAVISLRNSSFTRGIASHGRMYWPSTALAVPASTGRWSQAQRDGLKNIAVTMLQGINTAAAAQLGAGAHVVNTSPRGAGREARVDRVWVGDRPDHQERRENATAELYSVGNV